MLIENKAASQTLNHLGVEAPTPGHITAARERFQAAGLDTTVAEQDVCCHAVQDKVFVAAPDVPLGWWEFYSVTDDNPANPDAATTSVCAVSCAAQDSVAEEGAAEEGAAEEGAAEEGAAEEGAAEDGAAEDGAAEDGAESTCCA